MGSELLRLRKQRQLILEFINASHQIASISSRPNRKSQSMMSTKFPLNPHSQELLVLSRNILIAHSSKTFNFSKTDYYRQEVDDLVIEVQVRGTPIPEIRWTRDGVELDLGNSEKFFVMREPAGVYKLCIHDPQKIDGGRFVVEASNKAGKEEIRRTIRFLGKEHYKYLPGIRHADPKAPHEKEEEGPAVEVVPEVPESDEPEMVTETALNFKEKS